MTSMLSLYNGALRRLGERRLASLTEDRAPRRELDAVWDEVAAACLEQGFWRFAMRTVRIDPASDLGTQFGYTNVFVKPDDWVRTYQVSDNERLEPPLEDYQDEQGYWFADADPLYVRFVSNDADLGLNVATWPMTFVSFVEAALARAICLTITNGKELSDGLYKEMIMLRRDARSKDAMRDPPRMPPSGTWTRSRHGNSSNASRWNWQFR